MSLETNTSNTSYYSIQL